MSQRQKMRQRRAKEEQKREKKIDEVNERQIGKIMSRSANIDMTSNRHFPMVIVFRFKIFFFYIGFPISVEVMSHHHSMVMIHHWSQQVHQLLVIYLCRQYKLQPVPHLLE